MDSKLFLSTFGLIFLAELPDKTAMTTMLMAADGKPGAVFIGAAAAFAIQSAVAVICGQFIGTLPQRWVRLAAGIMFFLFALWSLRESMNASSDKSAEQQTPGIKLSHAGWRAFLVIFIAEWGDLTQLITASLASQTKNAKTIFWSSTLALWLVSAIAVVMGHKAKSFVKPARLKRLGAFVFGAVGVYFIAIACITA